jgi:glycosyltransferase involved in cell wall biosynthesis
MLVSVIIPVYNAELYVEKAIRSVINQTFPDFELLIIDDGSNDSCVNIIKSIIDPRIRFYSRTNQGQCKTLNFGIDKAYGDYIKFLDADDFLNSMYLESMMKIVMLNGASERKDLLFMSKWQRFKNVDTIIPMNQRIEWCDCTPLEFIKFSLGNGPDMLPGWQWLIPREILNKAGGWNENLGLGNDFEFSIRLILASKGIRFCDEAIVFYRSDLKQNMSSDKSLQTILSVLSAARLGINQILLSYNSEIIKKLCSVKLKVWLISYYPYISSHLRKEVEKEIKDLGESKITLDWSRKLRFIEKIFGWKFARMFQHYYYKIRYYNLASK